MPGATAVVWFRQDLRLEDNPALAAAAAGGRAVLPVHILDEDTPGLRPHGGAQRWWLHHGLAALGRDLAARGLPLVLRRGRADAVLAALIAETGAEAVHWNRCYDPGARQRDEAIKSGLRRRGIGADSHNAALLAEPWTIANGSGGFYQVFSAFWRAVQARVRPPQPGPAPAVLQAPVARPASDPLDDWALLPTGPDWSAGLRDAWVPGAAAAASRLDAFLDQSVALYGTERNRPDRAHTSRLSPHLHWGEIGPRRIWHAVQARAAARGGLLPGEETFLKELGWREFSHHLLYHQPQLAERCLRPEFERFPWQQDRGLQRAWTRGRTGYPIVDAGMRELWHTGWMHNRVRMIAGSFLVKHLLQDWRFGEAWFWDTLVDADAAANAASWQWIAGCGADAAPYFRIFNPVLQGRKFDPAGDYVRRWVPELARLGTDHLHAPWEAPAATLKAAGIRLGTTYPAPIIDHGEARARALAALASIRREVE